MPDSGTRRQASGVPHRHGVLTGRGDYTRSRRAFYRVGDEHCAEGGKNWKDATVNFIAKRSHQGRQETDKCAQHARDEFVYYDVTARGDNNHSAATQHGNRLPSAP